VREVGGDQRGASAVAPIVASRARRPRQARSPSSPAPRPRRHRNGMATRPTDGGQADAADQSAPAFRRRDRRGPARPGRRRRRRRRGASCGAGRPWGSLRRAWPAPSGSPARSTGRRGDAHDRRRLGRCAGPPAAPQGCRRARRP
jgi:hypothetical protein